MSLELLKAVLEYRPPKKLHRIGPVVLALYEEGNGTFSEEGLAVLRQELERCSADLKELSDANCALLGFVKLARNEWAHPDAGDQIMALVTETFPKYGPLFETIAETIAQLPQEVCQNAVGLFQRMVGEKAASLHAKAAVMGHVAAVNTVPLRKLTGPRSTPPPPVVRPRPVQTTKKRRAGR